MQGHLFTVLVALAGSACALYTRASSIQWVDCASNVPQPLQGLPLPKTLPSTLHCGRLDVPMDYAKPMGKDNTITLGFAMYRPNKSKGLINFNPGGPATEVASFAWELALNTSEAAMFSGLDGFDFLAADVRGTFSSNPLNCSIDDLVIPSSLPSNEAEFLAFQNMTRKFAQSCIDQSTPKGIVQRVGTADTVQDWNSLREALGYDKLHMLAVSYGTFGAQLYATKFPQNVGRFVLDGVFPHGISNLDLAANQVRAVNRLLLRADAFCIGDPKCPFHSQGKGSVVKAFGSLLDKVQSTKSDVSADDIRAVSSLGYLNIKPDFPAFTQALFAGTNGDLSKLVYNVSMFTKNFAPVLPIGCLDNRIDDNSFAGLDNIKKSIAKNDTARVAYSQDLTLIALCSGWLFHGDSHEPLSTDIPMVIVTSDFDVNTPTELADIARQQAPKSALIVRHGDGHGTFLVPGPARSVEIKFLTDGQQPAALNETLATVVLPGSQRSPIADPYMTPFGVASNNTNGAPSSKGVNGDLRQRGIAQWQLFLGFAGLVMWILV